MADCAFIAKASISDLLDMPVDDLMDFHERLIRLYHLDIRARQL